ncbi:MAG: RsmD family RNA methyltransferase [Candidatus Saccharimonadales bacterium]
MRVIAGRLGGRQFDGPRGNRTHPMSEKARGAIFNALGDIEGLTVLDTYSGTGALSIESISRGAASATAIEKDTDATKTIAANITTLGLEDSITLLHKNVSGWSRNNQAKQYDIVMADPPYTDIRPNVIERLAGHVKTSGILVLSWPGSEAVRQLKNLEVILHKSYGDIQLVFYKKTH